MIFLSLNAKHRTFQKLHLFSTSTQRENERAKFILMGWVNMFAMDTQSERQTTQFLAYLKRKF